MRIFLLALLTLISLGLAAQTNYPVEVTSNDYTPMVLTITVGDTVTWTNLQGVHNVNGNQDTYPSNPESFDSGIPAPPGWVFQHVFTVPGTYDYQCDPHLGLGMVGQVIVEDSGPNANVVINEIMYNPPESNNDTLEFIELFNIGDVDVSLEDWEFTDGVELTFPAVTIPAGGFLIVAGNASAFTSVFNYSGTVVEWTDGALSNGGENIELTDNNGIVIDAVDYDDNLPWPQGTDSEGASLVLCAPGLDNALAESWQAASTPTGIIINGAELMANPGAASSCGVPVPAIYFIDNQIVVNEDVETVTVSVVAQNFTTIGVDFTLSSGAATTATPGDDFSTNPALPWNVTQPLASLDTFELIVTIVDDGEVEDNEVIELALSAGTGEIAGDSLFTLTIFDNDSDVTVTPIGDINGIDADGVGLFLDSIRTVQGVVYCTDFDGNDGVQFFIQEAGTGNGLYVFSSTDVSDYQPMAGDEVQITGEIDQFRGLLQIRPQQIEVVSTGNDLSEPQPVNTLDESTEAKYVTLTLSGDLGDDAINVFGNGSINVSVTTFDGDSVTIRIDEETGIDSTSIANFFANSSSTERTVTGFGSQFDFDAPFDADYQILPCTLDDFGVIASTNEPTWATEVTLFPNPVNDRLSVDLPTNVQQFQLLNALGRRLQSGPVLTERLSVDFSRLAPGMYYLQLLDGSQVVSRPVVKR